MKKPFIWALLAVFAAVPVSDVEAAPILVPTASFETPDVPDQTNLIVTPAGWTFSGTLPGIWGFVSIFDPSNALYSNTTGLALPLPGSADGYQYVSIDNSGGGVAGNWALTTGTLASVADNMMYTLTVALGSSKASTPFEFTYLDLLVNGLAVATTQLGSALIPENTFGDFNVSFTTGASDPLTGGNLAIRLRVSESQFGVIRFADFDNVRVEGSSVAPPPPVPEPSALILLAMGGGLVAMRRRTS